MLTPLCALKYKLIMMWSNFVFVIQSTTLFTAISSVILLALTIYVAKKHPVKLHAVGLLTLAFGFLCFSVNMSAVFDTFQVNADHDPIYRIFELFQQKETITYQDFFGEHQGMWHFLVTPMRKACATLLWSFLIYTISRILYIIRTPRI